MIDHGPTRFAVEIKAGRGDRGRVAHLLEQAMGEIGAQRAWIVDQAAGTSPVRPNVERRGMAESLEWLPE